MTTPSTGKRDGGVITHWQFHTMGPVTEDVRKQFPDIRTDTVKVFTGTVKTDPTGRWKVGYHMRSSLVLSHDEKTGRVETENSIYTLEGPSGDVIPDIGAHALNIFY